MTLQVQINTDFLASYKSGDTEKKAALSLLKAALLTELKKNSKTELGNDDVIKVINSMVKTLNGNIEQYQTGNRPDLAEKEQKELNFISVYLPAPYSEKELTSVLDELAQQFKEGPLAKREGQTIGAFNKQHPGRATVPQIKEALKEILS